MSAGTVNKVIIIGNLGRQPEIRSFQNGGRIANLSIATSESWKDRNTGERKERTEWHRVVVLNDALVNICERFLEKGSKVYIEGQLETRKFTDQSGAERYTTEVVLRPFRGELTMLDSRREGQGQDDQDDVADSARGGSSGAAGGGGGGYRSPTPDDGFDDEIPF